MLKACGKIANLLSESYLNLAEKNHQSFAQIGCVYFRKLKIMEKLLFFHKVFQKVLL